jgi:ABC-type dipeptide/oligopeptide/nickel transport system ATPase component
MLFISHDLALVQALCSSIYIFKDGRVEDAGPSHFIFARSKNPYTRSLIDARTRLFVNLARPCRHRRQGRPPRSLLFNTSTRCALPARR